VDTRLLIQLANPACYPGEVKEVVIRQTHLSVVCLAGDYAYKLKKPVKFPFVDFSTLEKRQRSCEDEVRLNRRLCPEIYLGVVPLYRNREGNWSFASQDGAIEDWAVLMRRLPEDRLMDRLLEQDQVDEQQVRNLAILVARFHGRSERVSSEAARQSVQDLAMAIRANFTDTESFRTPAGLGTELPQRLQAAVEVNLNRLLPILEARARDGRVVDGHGDLHARNICLTDPPAIFDCIEFSPQLRIGDSAVENAFMVMDLIFRKRIKLAAAYIDAYEEASGDCSQSDLMPALVSYRAMVRAKVLALASSEPEFGPRERQESIRSARYYLQLAAAALLGEHQIALILCGLPGCGKSYLARMMADRFGWRHLSTDLIRKKTLGVSPEHELPESAYTPESSARAYAELLRQATQGNEHGITILDANFSTPEKRRAAEAALRPAGFQVIVCWIDVDEATAESRLRSRNALTSSGSDAGWDVYRKLRAAFQPPGANEGFPVFPLNGADGEEAKLESILGHLLGLSFNPSATPPPH